MEHNGKLGLALSPGSVEIQLQIRLIKRQDFMHCDVFISINCLHRAKGEGMNHKRQEHNKLQKLL